MLYNICEKVNLKFVNTPESFGRFFKNYTLLSLTEGKNNPNSFDIEITFIEKFKIKPGLKKITIYALYDEDGDEFYVVDKYGNLSEFFIDQLGENSIHLRCEKNFNPQDFYNTVLLPLIRCVSVNKGIAILHASAFIYKGRGVIFPAWAHSGKTNAVIYFLLRNAKFLADEHTIIDRNGYIWKNNIPLNIFGYNIKEFPEILKFFPLVQKLTYHAGRGLHRLSNLLKSCFPSDSKLKNLFHNAEIVCDIYLMHLKLNPAIFNSEQRENRIKNNYSFFIQESGKLKKNIIREMKSDDLAEKMQTCQEFEFMKFHQYLKYYTFAMGEGKNKILQSILDKELEIYKEFFNKSRNYNVVYSGDIRNVFKTLETKGIK